MSEVPEVEISVVVPFRNAERHASVLFESLTSQRTTESWEVIAVDNGSTDGSRGIVEGFQERLPLTIVTADARPGISSARNIGVRRSRGTKLLFIDADDAVHEEYVATMAAALDGHPFVTSRVDSLTLNPEWVRDAHGPHWQAEAVGVFYDFLPASGSNIGIRRDFYERLGGFPEQFAVCEDIAFSWNAQLLGHTSIHYVHDALYRYRYRDTLVQLFRQSTHWGAGSVRLYRDFRQLGMPGRTWRVAIAEWGAVLAGIRGATERAGRAAMAVRLGFAAGRLKGSVRNRVRYL
jgi:glycosyltransferase involved in cell wall biosynthesis